MTEAGKRPMPSPPHDPTPMPEPGPDIPPEPTPDPMPMVQELPAAAQRALAEAEARRHAIDAASAMAPNEKGGRGGLEPVRYGDWEKKGIAIDF